MRESQKGLRTLARAYFVTEVAGQTPAKIDAKRRDLTRFYGVGIPERPPFAAQYPARTYHYQRLDAPLADSAA